MNRGRSRSGPTVGVFGGSGFYSFLDKPRRVRIKTKYGYPSAPVSVSSLSGKLVAFLPRHGVHHEYPPHSIPYRANLQAFKSLGVQRVIGPCAVGSLKPEVKPGDFLFADQFVNFTSGRKDTFYDGPDTYHVGSADPYCPELRRIAMECSDRLGIAYHSSGTVVVVQGPRFSSRAESRFFRSQGWDIINMTQYPEAILARELELCYVNLSLVTDYDTGVEGDPAAKPVTNEEVVRVFNDNLARVRDLIAQMVKEVPNERSCGCARALEGAGMHA